MSKSQTITGQLEAMPGGPPSSDAVGLICQPADYRAIAPVAKHEGLKLFRDTAQGFGGVMDGTRARHWRCRGDQFLSGQAAEAAIVIERLKIFAEEIERLNDVARRNDQTELKAACVLTIVH